MPGCIHRCLALVDQLVVCLAWADNQVAIAVVQRVLIYVMNMSAFWEFLSESGFCNKYMLELFLSGNVATVIAAIPD